MTTLELINVHKTFGINTATENPVLKGLDIQVKDSDFVTIIGGNGAGKSTFLNAIAGSFPIEKGKVLLEGEDISKVPVHKRAGKISRVFQDTLKGTASRLTIEENMAIANKRGKKRGLGRGKTDKQSEFFKQELSKINLGLENRLDMEVGLLSGGQRQALTLMMATLLPPKILLLDEHTAALDPKTSQMVLELTEQIVQEKKLTTLMVTHNMEDAIRYGNRLIMMSNGKIVVDVRGEEKMKLTVPDLLDLFHQQSGQQIADDALILGH